MSTENASRRVFCRMAHAVGAATMVLALLLPGGFAPTLAEAAEPGLPFTEDFASTNLRDPGGTTADWSTEEQELLMAWRHARFGPFDGVSGIDIDVLAPDTLSLALGDVDGDGDVDIVAGNDGPNWLYLNGGDGTTWAASDITTDGLITYGVALADLNGDGCLDVVSGNYGINRLYFNNGTADPFNGVTGSDLGALGLETHGVAVGDVDGDGDLDIVTGNNDDKNYLYLNNGTSDPFAGVSGSHITDDIAKTYSVALGDMDDDGDLDVVTGDYDAPNRLYLNDSGQGDSWTGSDISSDSASTSSVALGDMNGDGYVDVVAGNDGATNRLYLSKGGSDPFEDVTGLDITSETDSTKCIVLGDVDENGTLDVLAGNYAQANRLYLNHGEGRSWTAGSLTGDEQNTKAVALGDLNGNGQLDAVAGNDDGDHSRVYLNNASPNPWHGTAGSDITADQGNTSAVVLGDVNGDGHLDVIAANDGTTNRLYLNNGTADPFNGVSGSDITSDADDSSSAALGDLDRDGDLDLVVGNNDEYDRVYLNDGTGTSWDQRTISDAQVNDTSGVALGDMDSDGDLDLVVGTLSRNWLFLNNGTSDPFNGVTGSAITSDTYTTVAVALGDVDGDGDLDVVGGNLEDPNLLYLNNGSGTSWTSITYEGTVRATSSVALGDVNGDGAPDIVAGNQPFDTLPGNNRVFINNGVGTAWIGHDVTGDTDITNGVALADVDEDGDLDVVAGNGINGSNQVNKVYLNSGNGTSWTGYEVNSYEAPTQSVGLGDVDGDGAPDLVTGNYGLEGATGWVNRLCLSGAGPIPWGGVTASHIGSKQAFTYMVAVADMDHDGDLDVVVANSDEPSRLYKNNGTDNPFSGVTSIDITSEANLLTSMTVGDMDGDGDVDVVTGNWAQHNKLFLNNGDGTSWTAHSVTGDADTTQFVAVGDVDGDGDLDVVAMNPGTHNRLYLNDGGAPPTFTGSDITTDVRTSSCAALEDMDGDGDLDVVVGNEWPPVHGDMSTLRNRLYVNENGVGSSWTGYDITGDEDSTQCISVGDVDRDGNLDVVFGAYETPTKLYLSDGGAPPTFTGSNVTGDAADTTSVALGDMDADGDLDVVAGNFQDPNRLYLNDGGGSSWRGYDVTRTKYDTVSVVLGDMDRDGALDIVAGTDQEHNVLFRRQLYRTGAMRAASLQANLLGDDLSTLILTATYSRRPHNTGAEFWMSTDGASKWYQVRSGWPFVFPLAGSDLRWKTDLTSLSPAHSPVIDEVHIQDDRPAPAILKRAEPVIGVDYHGVVTYTVVMSNTGLLPADHVHMTDTLPAEVEFARWIEQSEAVRHNDLITWTGTLTEDQVITWTWQITHTGGYRQVVTNTAWYGYDGLEQGYTATFEVKDPPEFEVVKTAQPAGDVPYHGAVTYTVAVTNTGPSPALGATLVDTLPTEWITFSHWINKNGAADSEGVITWSGVLTEETTVSWSWVVSHTGYYGDVVTNTVGITDTESGAVGQGEVGFRVSGPPNLSLSKQAEPSTGVDYHGVVTYSVLLTNVGESDADGTLLTDTLPSEVDFDRWLGDDHGATVTDDVIRWTGSVTALTGNLQWQWAVTHTGDYGEVVTNTVRATHPASGQSLSDDAQFKVKTGPSFVMTKTVSPSSNVEAGDPVTYAVSLDNTGESDANGVVMTDTLPVRVGFADWIEQNGATETGGKIEWAGSVPASGGMTWSWLVTFTGGCEDVVNTAWYRHPDSGSIGSASATFDPHSVVFYFPLMCKNAPSSSN